MPDRRGKRGATPPAIGWKAEVLGQPTPSSNTWSSDYPSSPPPSWEETQATPRSRQKSPQRRQKSKSLPNSPTKSKGGGGGLPRAPSFPNSPDKKTRTHRGHLYIEVPDSMHVEKETVL